LAVLALGLLLAAFQAGAATAPGNYIPTRPVVVTTGDTLWSIATQATLEGGDVQAMVVELQRINGLKDSRLQVGDVLEVPRQ
jgi:LysM repeat protein